MAKPDDRNESWTLDSPLEEISLEMVNEPTVEGNLSNAPIQPDRPQREKGDSSKTSRTRLRKKKPTRRRKS